MEDHYNHIDDLLAKKLAGESVAEEERQIEAWLRESGENRQYFQALQQIWTRSALSKPEPIRDVDTDVALQKVKSRIKGDMQARTVNLGFYMRIAAVFVGLLGLFWFFRQNNKPEIREIYAENTTRCDTLQDGSVVFLNKHSALNVEPGYGKKGRRLRLSGEAYFEVRHQEEQAFSVLVNDLEIRDIGTKFNVDNVSDPKKVLVSVTEGSVELLARNKKLLAKANETAVFDLQTGALSLNKSLNANVLAYKNRYFSFSATPLSAVVEALNRTYDQKIQIRNKALENCPLTADYDNLPLDRVVELIEEAFSISAKKEGDIIWLEGTGCE